MHKQITAETIIAKNKKIYRKVTWNHFYLIAHHIFIKGIKKLYPTPSWECTICDVNNESRNNILSKPNSRKNDLKSFPDGLSDRDAQGIYKGCVK